jgi:hypothetical protein
MSYPGQIFEDPSYYDEYEDSADQAWDDSLEDEDDEQT